MYRLVITTQAQKELKKIRITSEVAMKLALEDISEMPELGKPLSRNLTRKFSYRVGVYRIIYQVNEKDKIVTILSAGHRFMAYN